MRNALAPAIAALIAAAATADDAETWATRILQTEAHNEVAFQLGPRLVDAPRDVALEAVENAWGSIAEDGVKTGLLKAFHFGQHPDVLDVLHLGATDASEYVREYAFTYLAQYAWQDFNADPESYAAWRMKYAGKDVEDVLHANVAAWVKRYLAADESVQVEMMAELNEKNFISPPNTKTHRPSVLRYAEQAGLSKDDLTGAPRPPAIRRYEVADTPPLETEERFAGGDPNKRYFQIGGGDAPENGYKLLVVLPGGDGSENFRPFVERLANNWVPPGYLVVQLVAKAWTPDQFQRLVWPTETNPFDGAEFTTEAFIDAVISDVGKTESIDLDTIYVMGWSSGGPPAYAATLGKDSPIRGAFILSSVFKPPFLPNLAGADDKAFFILHSPTDFIPIDMAIKARDDLQAHGAATELETYRGGHGWPQKLDVVARGLRFLEQHQPDSE